MLPRSLPVGLLVFTVVIAANVSSGRRLKPAEEVPARSSRDVSRPLSGITNLALHKPATQSSIYPHTLYAVAAKAVDGNTNGNFGSQSVTHTRRDAHAWWEVDLMTQSVIKSVIIFNRLDCCRERLTYFDVKLFDYAYQLVRVKSYRSPVRAVYTFHFDSMPEARYVQVMLHRWDYLSLAEVQVLGTAIGGYENVAYRQPASQSSNYSHHLNPIAAKAVDGNTNGAFSAASTTHTNKDDKAWWQVDLGKEYLISAVTIYNRIDCCGDRLQNFEVILITTDGTPSMTLSHHLGVQRVLPFMVPLILARYVKVQLKGTNYLQLAEVQVFSRLTNLALNKAAWQSSDYSSDKHPVAGKAVDGILEGRFNLRSVTATNKDVKAWWEVDLGHQAMISSILVYNRLDCCKERLSNFELNVFDYAHRPVRSVPFGAEVKEKYECHFESQPMGRYVEVQLQQTDYLSLAEVQVFGTIVGGYENVAYLQPASQSSTYVHTPYADAGRAVDGNTNGHFPARSTTHTMKDTMAWWQVDLGREQAVTVVTIFNRVDCCGERLQNFNVKLSNQAGALVETLSYGTGVERILTFTVSPPVNARYVRVELKGQDYLQLAEVQVFAAITNLALQKKAIQSSVYPSSHNPVASKAVDGNRNGGFRSNSVTHTHADAQAWWQVDLEHRSIINSVVVFNRLDCCKQRLTNFDIKLLGNNGQLVKTASHGNQQQDKYDFHFNPASVARYVKVQLKGKDYLSLAEVEVFGTPLADATNLALRKPAIQSSTYPFAGHSDASRAVDGNTEGRFGFKSVTHTQRDAQAWWEVDLHHWSVISSVSVFNRIDCCKERLSNFDVKLFGYDHQLIETMSYEDQVRDEYVFSLSSPLAVRYVRVQLKRQDYLSLAEVQVAGKACYEPVPPAPQYGWVQTRTSTDDVYPLIEVVYNCFGGYKLVGSATRKCDGVWKGNAPICQLSVFDGVEGSCNFVSDGPSNCIYVNSAENNVNWISEVHTVKKTFGIGRRSDGCGTSVNGITGTGGTTTTVTVDKASLPTVSLGGSGVTGIKRRRRGTTGDSTTPVRRRVKRFSIGCFAPPGLSDSPSSTVTTTTTSTVLVVTTVISNQAFEVGPFVKHESTKYAKFSFYASDGVAYALYAHAHCLPDPPGHLDHIGSTTNNNQALQIVSYQSSGSHTECLNLKDAVSCYRFSLRFSAFIVHLSTSEARLSFTPKGTYSSTSSAGCVGPALNEV